MGIAAEVLGILTVVVTLLALIQRKEWWIRIFDFPRLPVILLQAVSIIVILIFSDQYRWHTGLVSALVFVSMMVQWVYIYPYLPFHKKEVPACDRPTGGNISLMVANVWQDNRQSDKLVAVLKREKPDILLLVETNRRWTDDLKALDDLYPHSLKKPLENTYGMLLYSRYALNEASVEYLYKEEIPSIHTRISADGFHFRLACLHPEPPAPDEAELSRPRDRELIKMARRVQSTDSPYVVMGDFNDVPWSYTSNKFRTISELKDPRRGRGFYNTFHAKIPGFRFALDHIFLSDEFTIRKIKRCPKTGSDHFPIFVECCYSPK